MQPKGFFQPPFGSFLNPLPIKRFFGLITFYKWMFGYSSF
ncbi:hypothetical protein VPHK290_0020 [Vibrio phage K290]